MFNPDLKILSCCDNAKTVLFDRHQNVLIASSPTLSVNGEEKHWPQVLVEPPHKWLYQSLPLAPN